MLFHENVGLFLRGKTLVTLLVNGGKTFVTFPFTGSKTFWKLFFSIEKNTLEKMYIYSVNRANSKGGFTPISTKLPLK